MDATAAISGPPRPKPKAYNVLGDFREFEHKLTATLPPPKAPEPENIETVDRNEFPSDVWFAATISPDNGAAVIASYREICKARSLYQQQLGNIYQARRQQELLSSSPTKGVLGRATIAETIKHTGDLRKLDKFDLRQQDWDNVANGLASKIKRPLGDLAMQRGPAWRNRAELTELLYRAQPLDVRGTNPEMWNMSLRDAWERIIPLGSIFSGLAAIVKEKPHTVPPAKGIKIGRPLEPPVSTLRAPAPPPPAPGLLGRPPAGRSLSARGRAWEDSALLAARLDEYGKRIKSLQPHDPEFDTLKLRGEALESQLEALAYAPVTLAEVEGHLRTNDPGAYGAYKEVKDQMEAELAAALEAEARAQAAEEEMARARAPQPGPHLEASTSYLTLACHAGEGASAAVSVACRGTAAVRYRWRRLPRAQLRAAPSDASRPRFMLAQQAGVLLPGQEATFTVSFRADEPGTYAEDWRLETVPPALGDPVALSLHGYAERRDESAVGRGALDAALAEKEKAAKVQAALKRILHDVRSAPKPAPKEAAGERDAREAWDRAHLETHWPPLYHSPELAAELGDVYGKAAAALAAALAPPVEEDPKKKKKEAATKKKGEEPPPPPPKYPPEWDGTLALLEALLAELGELQPAAAAPLAARLEAAKGRALVPSSRHKVLQHAMRALVHKMLDAVDEKLQAVEGDYRNRLAEQQRQAEGGGEEGGGGGGALEAKPSAADAARQRQSMSGVTSTVSLLSAAAPSGAVVDAQWLHDKMVSGTKAVLKVQLTHLNDELLRHRLAVGDTLEAQVRALDVRIEAASDGPEREQLYWERFALLRTWTGLGVPPRGDIQ